MKKSINKCCQLLDIVGLYLVVKVGREQLLWGHGGFEYLPSAFQGQQGTAFEVSHNVSFHNILDSDS